MKHPVSLLLSTISFWQNSIATQLLYMDKSHEVTEFTFESFQKSVLLDESSVNWVIVFYADWCGHCVSFAPQYIELAEAFKNSDHVQFGAIDCAADIMTQIQTENVCRVYDIKSYPTIRLFRHGKNERDLPRGIEELRTAIESFGVVASQPITRHRSTPLAGAVDNNRFSNSAHTDVLHDASLAFYEILHHEVFRGSDTILSGSSLADLVHLLQVCQNIDIADFMRDGCRQILDDTKEAAMLSRARWNILLTHHFASIDVDSTYLACSNFSCAMWRLLHVMSLSQGIEKTFMEDIRFLIDKYFSCDECRTNFLHHFDNCDFGRCSASDQMSVALWLWRLHNAVNTRLGHPQWPSSSFSDSEVYSLLKSTYSRDPPDSEPLGPVAFLPTSVFVMAGGGFVVLGLILGLARNGDRIQTTFSRLTSQVNKKYYEPIV